MFSLNYLWQELFATSQYNRDHEASFGMEDGGLLREGVHKCLTEESLGDVIGVMMRMEFIGRSVIVRKMDVMLDTLYPHLQESSSSWFLF